MPRPAYLGTTVVPPPSHTTLDERATLRYRCNRLRGVMNIYYWALRWTVHNACDWEMGEEWYPFVLTVRELWLLGVETLAELTESGWDEAACHVTVRKRETNISGVIRLVDIPQRRDGKVLVVNPVSWSGSNRTERPRFTGEDLAVRVEFRDEVNCLPWLAINSALNRAYTNAEQHLKPEGIFWKGPPLFKQCQDGGELLNQQRAHGLSAGSVLADLEERRRSLSAEIETVLRADAQRQAAAENANREHSQQQLEESESLGDCGLKKLKRPSERAFIVYRLEIATGMKQSELAAKMTEMGYSMDQGTVSRELTAVREFLAAGNVLPVLHRLSKEPDPVDPDVIEMGARQDHRTPRQRERADADSDDE